MARQFNLIPPVCEQAEYHFFQRDKVESQLPELYHKIGEVTAVFFPKVWHFQIDLWKCRLCILLFSGCPSIFKVWVLYLGLPWHAELLLASTRTVSQSPPGPP